MNKVEDYSIEVWQGYGDGDAYYIPTDKIRYYVIPNINPTRYFEVNKEMLADKYDIEEDELTMNDIDWEDEQMGLGDLDEYAVELENFDEELAEQYGYHMPTESDLIYKAYHYLDSGSNWRSIWEEDMETSHSYRITEEYVRLDEWDGNNYRTGGNFNHEDVHRIIDGDFYDDGYVIIWHSQWQGSQPQVVKEGLSLEQVLDYIANIDDGLDRDLEEYKSKLLEL